MYVSREGGKSAWVSVYVLRQPHTAPAYDYELGSRAPDRQAVEL
jgi:hypothetical protein